MRPHERLLLLYFAYVALISPFFIAPWKPLAIFLLACGAIVALQRTRGMLRDWAALVFVLTAYREMDLFTPLTPPLRFETGWLALDHVVLANWHLRDAIESLGAILVGYLELSYALVYTAGLAGLGILRWCRRRESGDEFLFYYVAGAILSYALFPYFPSQPPRLLFPEADPPRIYTAIRDLNLWLLGGYGIHSSVFPSAHVSSAFGAAWGLLATLRDKRWIGWCMCAYAFSVALATVYGRYHYAVDALAGIGISLIAWGLGRWALH